MRRAFSIRVTMLCLSLMFPMLLASVSGVSAQNRERQLLTFYNVENLFDTINNPASADEDMLPLADRAWGRERYKHKIDALARVIADMQCEGCLPAIVGLAEVENRGVLESLTSHAHIRNAAYQICHIDSPDRRGIDVALLYRPDVFKVESVKAVPISVAKPKDFKTRDLLVVRGEFCGERFIFVVVHWPSRLGGVEASELLRMASAKQLRDVVDSAMSQFPDVKIVVMGDMNDNPSNRSLRQVLRARKTPRRLQQGDLYNPFARRVTKGSSRYDGRWNRFDNIIISANLLDGGSCGLGFNCKGTKNSSAYIFRRDYMCDKRGYPLPTYRGSEYVGGVSDHLPVCLILQRELVNMK